ncbi:MAG: hypothetical protein ABI811_06340 [Acidobacteriota bacterium]
MPIPKSIPAVHLTENRDSATRQSQTTRAFPLGEPNRPSRATGLDAIVRYLDVEHSPRYQRTPASTFCNIYACDYCYLAGAYLPRVWWTSTALASFAQGRDVAVKYGVTVAELSANALYDWLRDFGPTFGWTQTTSLDVLQSAANAGQVAVICVQAAVLSRPGHITAVIPESAPTLTAQRQGETVLMPL